MNLGSFGCISVHFNQKSLPTTKNSIFPVPGEQNFFSKKCIFFIFFVRKVLAEGYYCINDDAEEISLDASQLIE